MEGGEIPAGSLGGAAGVALHGLPVAGGRLELGGPEMPVAWSQRLQAEPEVFLVDATRVRERYPVRIRNGWEINVYAVQHSRFREVLLLDAYNVPVAEPCFFIDITEVRRLGFLPENSEILQIRRNAGLHFTNLLLGST